MAKKPATNNGEKNMSKNETAAAGIDPLSDLGLDVGAAQTEGAASGNTETDMPRTPAPTVEIGKAKELPTTTRTGGGQSKYPFASLEAPTADGYSFFRVAFNGGDEKAFRRSVQSATTQQNSSNKDKYFISRSEVKDGKLVAMVVYRTDERPASE